MRTRWTEGHKGWIYSEEYKVQRAKREASCAAKGLGYVSQLPFEDKESGSGLESLSCCKKDNKSWAAEVFCHFFNHLSKVQMCASYFGLKTHLGKLEVSCDVS